MTPNNINPKHNNDKALHCTALQSSPVHSASNVLTIPVDHVVEKDHLTDGPNGLIAHAREQGFLVAMEATKFDDGHAFAEGLDECIFCRFKVGDQLRKLDGVIVSEIFIESPQIVGFAAQIDLELEQVRKFFNDALEIQPLDTGEGRAREVRRQADGDAQQVQVRINVVLHGRVEHFDSDGLWFRIAVGEYLSLVDLANATATKYFVQLDALPPIAAVGLLHETFCVSPGVGRGVVLELGKDAAKVVPKQVGSGTGPLEQLDDGGAAVFDAAQTEAQIPAAHSTIECIPVGEIVVVIVVAQDDDVGVFLFVVVIVVVFIERQQIVQRIESGHWRQRNSEFDEALDEAPDAFRFLCDVGILPGDSVMNGWHHQARFGDDALFAVRRFDCNWWCTTQECGCGCGSRS